MDQESWSDRLGPITSTKFQTALDRFDLGKLISAERVATGNFGQNVFLTSSEGRFVFRGNPLLAWQFRKEQVMARLLAKGAALAGPWPYHHDVDTGIFG